MLKKMISFLLILSILVSYSAFALSNDKYVNLKYDIIEELAQASGKNQDSILREHSQLIEDYVKVSKWEEKKIKEFKARQIEDTNKINSIVKLSPADIKNLNNNLGLNQENHNRIQNYIYKNLDELPMLDIDESNKIETVINNLFWMKELNYRDNDDYEFESFMINPDDLSDSQLYFIDSIKLEKHLEKERMKEIEYINKNDKYKIFVSIDEINIDGGNAITKVITDNIYLYPNETIGISLINYTIKLINIDGKWLIDDIRDNSPKESYYLDNKIEIKVEETVNELKKSLSKVKQDENQSALKQQELLEQTLATAAVSIPYIPSYCTSYAKTYALGYNSNFPSYANNGGDCQNFGSQCIWYGFGGVNSSTFINSHSSPMIDDGVDSSNSWYHGGTKYDTGSNWAWTGVTYYRDYVRINRGLTAVEYNGVAYARVGDIVQVSWNGNSTFNHTYVVTAVTGTLGSRTPSDITICGHTPNQKDVKLDLPNSYYRTLCTQGWNW